MSAFVDPLLEKVIHGYKLEELIGRGNITAMYHARAERPGRYEKLLATILLTPSSLSDKEKARFQERFLQTAAQISTFRHPNILPLHNFGTQDGYCYFFSPEIQGETLLSYLNYRQRLTPLEAFSIITPIAIAVDYLHSQGWVNVFFHPSNIVLLDNDAGHIQNPVQLTGLGLPQILRKQGIAEKPLSPTGYEHLQSILGTYLGAPAYLAPEIMKGKEGDMRSDIYSLGVLLFVLLAGRAPFEGEDFVEIADRHLYEVLPSLHDYAPDVPFALELVVNHALQRNPDFRFQKAEELITAYAEAVNAYLNTSEYLATSNIVEQVKALMLPQVLAQLQLPSGEQEQGKTVPLLSTRAQSLQFSPERDTVIDLEATVEEPPLQASPETPTRTARWQKSRPASPKITGVLTEPMHDDASRQGFEPDAPEEEASSIITGDNYQAPAASATRPLEATEQFEIDDENLTTRQMQMEMVRMAHQLQVLRERLQLQSNPDETVLRSSDDQQENISANK